MHASASVSLPEKFLMHQIVYSTILPVLYSDSGSQRRQAIDGKGSINAPDPFSIR
jgi:hypothetical protein